MAGPWERYAPAAVPTGEVSVTFEDAAPPGPWSRYAQVPPVEPIGPAGRLAQGAADPIHGGAQFLAHALPTGVVEAVNDATGWVNRQPVIGPVTRALGMTPATPQQLDQRIQERERTYQAGRTAAGDSGLDAWRLAGNIGTSLPMAIMAPNPATLTGATMGGALANAGMALTEPVTSGDYAAEKKRQVETGAAFGAVGGAAGRLLGRAIAPDISPQARTLADAGVQMTPGQLVGGGVRRVEDALTSIPIIGEPMRAAQRGSVESMNRAVGNRVLAPLSETVPENIPVGRELVEYVGNRASAAYDAALQRIAPTAPDQMFAQDLRQATARFLTPDMRRTLNNWMRENVLSRLNSGRLTAEQFKNIDSEIGRAARNYGASANGAERELAESLRDVQAAFRSLVERANPTVAEPLRNANAAWANLVRMETAAASAGARDGVFSGAQLSQGVRRADASARHRGFARGNALMQDVSDAASTVLPSTVPDSGTPLRAMASMAATGGVNLAAGLNPALVAGSVGVHGLYSQPGLRAAQAFLTRNPSLPTQAVGGLLSNAPLSGMLARGLLGAQ